MIKQYNVPLIYIVFNNSSLGNVRDFLSRKGRGLTEYDDINFAAIANAMGIQGIRIEDLNEIKPTLEKSLLSDKPTLIDIVVNRASHLRIRSSL
jgi:pyruvate dehydrogenase (quinone)